MYLACKGCAFRYTPSVALLYALLLTKYVQTCTRMTSLTLTLKNLVKIIMIQMAVTERYKLGKERLIDIEEIYYLASAFAGKERLSELKLITCSFTLCKVLPE